MVTYSHNDRVMLRTPSTSAIEYVPTSRRNKARVRESHHRTANNLRGLGLGGAAPLAVAATHRFQSRLKRRAARRSRCLIASNLLRDDY